MEEIRLANSWISYLSTGAFLPSTVSIKLCYQISSPDDERLMGGVSSATIMSMPLGMPGCTLGKKKDAVRLLRYYLRLREGVHKDGLSA